MFTRFFDMCSGGDEKTPYSVIYVEGDAEAAAALFNLHFDRDPYNVTCDCCGGDYSIDTYDTLAEATRGDGDYRRLVIGKDTSCS